MDELRADASAADVQLDTDQLEALTALAVESPAFHHRARDKPCPPSSASVRP